MTNLWLIGLITFLAVTVPLLAALWLFGPWKPGSRHAGINAKKPTTFRPLETHRAFQATQTQPGKWRG